MTESGSQNDAGQAGGEASNRPAGAGHTLVFDAAGRLRNWTPGIAALPGAGGRLAAGAALADLDPLFEGMACVDRPLADGGFLRMVGQGGCQTASPPSGDLSGRLFAAASHDLRQPLAALSLLIGTLDGRVAADRASRDLLRSMAQAVESMRGMVDGHFDLARLEAGLIEPDIRPHAINGVLMRLALDVAPRFAERGVRFTVMPCSGVVRTDGSLLERLLHGLVANALRHTPQGRVVVGCRPRGDSLRIEVWDTGRGLAPRQLDALRTELAGPGGYGHGALGLGLTLARGLARKLGLSLEVRSIEKRGTLFSVTVPRAADGEGVGRSFSPAPRMDADTSDLNRTRVLVIEDDPMVLAALEALLGQWGCTVLAAESCDSALDRLGTAPQAPDLIISDLRLKGTANGIVAIRRIVQALGQPVPGMILTGDTDPKRLREARLSGYPLLHKPIAPLALRAAVSRLLARETMIT
ncbi:hybrid sensor histidine kinase/response regulator [Azospirillum agricola]|uniref:hybrid sensor histidine kinase/response regulator n=1 Tax=Azospirillum agricola TaxID=1720247 RepID=UPI000A0F1149|nr:hybrid sensor histidine kinase/response regulator [Azospirillum agricola]SMH51774.1 His Kinase A (phospho-acceptor) domain-containing protein [Azospirillum lipoferum]